MRADRSGEGEGKTYLVSDVMSRDRSYVAGPRARQLFSLAVGRPRRHFLEIEREKGLLFLVAFRMRFSQNTNPLFPKKLFFLSALFGFSLFRKVGVSVTEMVLWAFYENPNAHLVSEKNDIF